MKLITIDGVDFSGKSTLARQLKNHLIKKGHTVMMKHFPSEAWENPVGEMLQNFLLGRFNTSVIYDDKLPESPNDIPLKFYGNILNYILFEMDRVIWENSLDTRLCDYLIFDRSFYSGIAYDAHKIETYDETIRFMKVLFKIADGVRKKSEFNPVASIIIDCDSELLESRIKNTKRDKLYLYEKLETLKKVNDSFNLIGWLRDQATVVVDVAKDNEATLFERCLNLIEPKL